MFLSPLRRGGVFGLLLVYSVIGRAVPGGAELDRNLISMYEKGEGEVWLQGDYVNGALAEQFGYEGTSSGISYSQALTVGGKYALSDRFTLRLGHGRNEDEAWRSTEPKTLRNRYQSSELSLQHLLYSGQQFDVAWHFGGRAHQTLGQGLIKNMQFSSGGSEYLVETGGEVVNLTKITGGVTNWTQSLQQSGDNIVSTGTLVAVPITVPLITLGLETLDTGYLVQATPKDAGVGMGLDFSYYPSEELRFSLGGEVRELEVTTNYKVNPSLLKILDNQLAGNLLGITSKSVIENQTPQSNPWDETHLLLTAGADWVAYEDLSFAAQYTYYHISRDGYQSLPAFNTVAEQTTNHQLDGWIFVKPAKEFTVYLHGRAYSNFLLGDRPLLYNARVNHRFTDPFGYLSAGIVWEF